MITVCSCVNTEHVYLYGCYQASLFISFHLCDVILMSAGETRSLCKPSECYGNGYPCSSFGEDKDT